MADQNTKDINTINNITSIDANDYLFVSDQGSALRKANSNVVSKYAVETYTTTLGGVNNKTVQSAINDLNSKQTKYTIKYGSTASVSGSTYTYPSISQAIDAIVSANGNRAGRYMAECINSTSYSDTYSSIISANSTLIIDVIGSSYINVIAITIANPTVCPLIKRIKGSGNVWSNWVGLPSRDEMNALNSKLGRLITSGSLHDILTSGIYYIGSSVTDQPVQQDGYGGTYIVSSANENTLVGIYISMYDKSIWSITKLNATWTHTQMAKTAWKLAGTATGNNELSLPSTNWNELRVIVYLTSTPNEGRVGYNITRQEIADTTGTPFYVNGRFPSSGGQAQIAVSGAYVKLDTYMVGTTNRVADATIRVYYR